jgi:hypothetical protein
VNGNAKRISIGGVGLATVVSLAVGGWTLKDRFEAHGRRGDVALRCRPRNEMVEGRLHQGDGLMPIPAWVVKLVAARALRAWLEKRRKKIMTNGMKTSEFWMTIATFVANFIATKTGDGLPVEAVALVIAYVLSRAVAKLKG